VAQAQLNLCNCLKHRNAPYARDFAYFVKVLFSNEKATPKGGLIAREYAVFQLA